MWTSTSGLRCPSSDRRWEPVTIWHSLMEVTGGHKTMVMIQVNVKEGFSDEESPVAAAEQPGPPALLSVSAFLSPESRTYSFYRDKKIKHVYLVALIKTISVNNESIAWAENKCIFCALTILWSITQLGNMAHCKDRYKHWVDSKLCWLEALFLLHLTYMFIYIQFPIKLWNRLTVYKSFNISNSDVYVYDQACITFIINHIEM